ncbi:ATPase [Thermococcus siculi]|uniref:ATPase n=1 Tax=Thermococcus siculi TaxID=72803 RepID=A0A2Z2MHA4_9EURY|nr:ATPase domain-containing protein [Thermococcus siculi]ASJ07739.1 ATPase [Thermococcus siculi]
MEKRISTGVKGLDEMLQGGLIPGRVYLVKGGPGTGKTTLAVQFIMEGVKNDEKCLYITLEESAKLLKENMAKLGFDLNHPNVRLIDATPGRSSRSVLALNYEELASSFNSLTKSLEEILRSGEYSRVVIDPITMMKLTIKEALEYRRLFLKFLDVLNHYNVTALFTAELISTDIEEYMVSGAIELRRTETSTGRTLRGIKIVKFRGSSFDDELRPYAITEHGMEVYSRVSFKEISI